MSVINLGDGVKLYTDDEWRTDQERPNFSSMQRRPGRPDGVLAVREFIGHHTGGATLGDPDPRQWLRNIWHYHVDGRRYSDIAYESAVDMDGNIWALRDNAFVGAHTLANPPDGISHNAVGHACVLLRTTSGLTPPAKLALRKNYGLQVVAAGWRYLGILVHKDVDPGTECPGDDVRDFFHDPNGLRHPSPAGPGAVPPGAPGPPQAIPVYPGYMIMRGSKGSVVQTWQHRLNEIGFGPLAVDGDFGNLTDAATRRFQGHEHLVVDGKVGPKTWDAAF